MGGRTSGSTYSIMPCAESNLSCPAPPRPFSAVLRAHTGSIAIRCVPVRTAVNRLPSRIGPDPPKSEESLASPLARFGDSCFRRQGPPRFARRGQIRVIRDANTRTTHDRIKSHDLEVRLFLKPDFFPRNVTQSEVRLTKLRGCASTTSESRASRSDHC